MTPIGTLCDPGDRCRQSERCARAHCTSPDAQLIDGTVLLRRSAWCPLFLDLRGAALRVEAKKREGVTA